MSGHGRPRARSTARRVAAALLAVAAVSACAADGPTELENAAAAQLSGDPVPYEVRVSGNVDEELQAFLESVSEAKADEGDPPRSFLALRRRGRTDADRLKQALASKGYYDGAVVADVTAAPGRPDTDLALVQFEVTTGPAYRFAALQIDVQAPDDGYVPPSLDGLGLVRGETAAAETVLTAEQSLLERALDGGRARAALGERETIIDRDTKTMDVTLRIAPGPVVELAAPTFTGDDSVDPAYLASYAKWEAGETYNPDLIRDMRRDLVGTQLFTSATVELADEPGPDGRVPVIISLDKRARRTVSAGVRYQTDGGPGGSVSWEHRNLFGAGERFRISADADLLRQFFGADLRKPNILGRDSALLADASIERQDTDAFKSNSATAGVGLEYSFSTVLNATLGLRYRASDVDDNVTGREQFDLLSVPAVLRYDGTDSLLNPQHGARLSGEFTPFWDVRKTDLQFNRMLVEGSTYLKVSRAPNVVLAFRAAYGSIFGADTLSIPATERFYAGGGGSIRGIPYQRASPLDANGDPIGGRSLIEFSTEIRYDFTETIGAVAFVDGGAAFDQPVADFEDDLRFGTGVGLRYYTPVGPLRADVAVPVDRRSGDDAFQLYISLGQAF